MEVVLIKKLLVLFILLTVFCLAFMTGCDKEEPSSSENSSVDESESTGSSEATESTQIPGPYQFRSGEIGNYVIVYSGENTDYYRLANELRIQISDKYGKSLAIKRDTNLEPTKYEILLGDTNRYDHVSNVMEYSVTVDEGKFRINVGGSFSAEQAMK